MIACFLKNYSTTERGLKICCADNNEFGHFPIFKLNTRAEDGFMHIRVYIDVTRLVAYLDTKNSRAKISKYSQDSCTVLLHNTYTISSTKNWKSAKVMYFRLENLRIYFESRIQSVTFIYLDCFFFQF